MFQNLQRRHRPQVEAILRQTGVFNDREVDVCLEMADECLQDPEQEEYVFECAINEQERAIGFVVYGEAALADRVWEVYWIAVDPSQQKQRLGRALMDHAEQAMRAAGARMSLIETSGRPDYVQTNSFYLRCGYKEAARVHDFYREGDDLVIFRKDFGVC